MSENSSLRGRNIVVGITGGIAAYKSATLVREFVKRGAEVQVIMTPNAREFITPVTLSTLSGRPVITEFFTANTGQWNSHVSLGLWADAFVIAPATASTIAKMATGVADNMLVTSYLSARCQVFAAPAMDLDMWAHPTTARNLAILRTDGVKIIEPRSGELASHLTGKGRMEEPEAIADAVEAFFITGKTLAGRNILITAGPTVENIDPVRYIGNYSTGKMGYALAAAAASRGAEVTLVSGPTALDTPAGVHRVDTTDARSMLDACVAAFPDSDAAIMCAAVADYAPVSQSESKIKRENTETLTLTLRRNPDIAATLGSMKRPDQTLVGFALETDNARANAERKIKNKHLDWIVLNSLRDPGAGFATDTNRVSIIAADGTCVDTSTLPKTEIAGIILDTVFPTPD